MQILFNLAFSQFYLYNLDNGARCTETSVSFTYISCFMTCKLSVFSQPRMYADDTSLAFSGADLKHIDGMYPFYFDYKFTNRFSGFFFILKLLLDHRSEIKINQILKEK